MANDIKVPCSVRLDIDQHIHISEAFLLSLFQSDPLSTRLDPDRSELAFPSAADFNLPNTFTGPELPQENSSLPSYKPPISCQPTHTCPTYNEFSHFFERADPSALVRYIGTTRDKSFLIEACLFGILNHVPRQREVRHLVRSGNILVCADTRKVDYVSNASTVDPMLLCILPRILHCYTPMWTACYSLHIPQIVPALSSSPALPAYAFDSNSPP